jgi:hypothetical protein
MIDNDGLVDIFFDLTPNALKNDAVRDQICQQTADRLRAMVPGILTRMEEVAPFITVEIGAYAPIISDAKACYDLGLFRAAVALAGVAAEDFASDLYERVELQRDGINLKKKLFGEQPRAERTIDVLFLDGSITRATRDSLHDIRKIRNKYVHPDHASVTDEQMKTDALTALNKFHDILSARFSEKYYFQDGKIFPR